MTHMQILSGFKVIDITQFISGSRCTGILADMGADVIKVEPPQGDTLRLIFKLMPGAERCYSVFNRNKYGIAVDWRDPRGRDVVRKLAAGADVFVHNLVPGALERGGLGYDDIRALFIPVLRHRILLNFHAESDRLKQDDILQRLLEWKPAPRGE